MICARTGCTNEFPPVKRGNRVKIYCCKSCKDRQDVIKVSNSPELRKKQRDAQHKYVDKYKEAAFVKLGTRCSNPDCRWINSDGTTGCTDRRCLQFDHVNGDGYQERLTSFRSGSGMLYKAVVLDKEDRYQLLCANCNWIKRVVNKENPQRLDLAK